MAKKVKYVPEWRHEQIWSWPLEDMSTISLEDHISRLRSAEATALATNPFLKDFRIDYSFDEYEGSMVLSAVRPETEDEKLMRLGKHPAQIEAAKKQRESFKLSAEAEVRRLCKKLKVQSPV